MAIIEKYADLFSSIEMEKIELEKELLVDKLTGIKNRRALEEIAPKILNIERRDNRQFSLLMLDIDNFKKYNDALGHPAGDELLKELPKIIGGVIRKSDLLFRYGGEEFIVALPETGKQGAMETAEKIRKVVEEKVFEIKSVPEESKDQKITLSLGVFSSEQLPENSWKDHRKNKSDAVLKEMISKADTALYKAKKEGRNQSVLFHESMENDLKKERA